MTGFRPAHALRGRSRLVLAVVLLAVILALAIAALDSYLQVDEIQLMDLRGMQYSEAAAMLRERELVPVSYPENVQGAGVEAVTSQTPPPGSVVRRGRTVAIGVNRPPEASRAPVLLGLTADQALNSANAANLALESVEFAHSDQPAGRVIRQQPEPGERIGPGGGVAVVVSRGPEESTAAMPELLGMTLDRARRRLQELGVRSVESVATDVSFDSPGTVTSQQPSPGEPLSISTPVILSYSLSARSVVPVPELVGESAAAASRSLRAAGLTLGEIRYVDDPEREPGSVVEVVPAGHTLRGTPIILTVNAAAGSFDDLRAREREERAETRSDEPGSSRVTPGDTSRAADSSQEEGDNAETGGRRVSVTFDPAALGVRSLMERDYDLKLVVQDEEGERVVVDRRVRAGEKVSAVVLVQGDALLQTYINGVFFQAWRP